MQAQDGRAARLAVRARSSGLVAGDVDRALQKRLLVITWLNRGTLHLVRSEDYPWLQALTTPPIVTANARRLEQEGVSRAAADRGVAAVERALAERGPLTRAELREVLRAARVRAEGQALVHVLMLASLRGLIVRGPMAGREQAFVLVRDWLPKPARIERQLALAELARRYLAGHGPATDRDLARWAGLPLGDARRALKAIGSEVADRGGGLVALAGRGATAKMPRPRLLGPWEPVLLGWTSRDEILGGHRGLVTINGVFKPFAMIDGRAAATWSMPAGEVQLEPLRRLTAAERAALKEDGADVVRFLAS